MIRLHRGHAIHVKPLILGFNHKPKGYHHETFFFCKYCKRIILNKTHAEHFLIGCTAGKHMPRYMTKTERERIKALKKGEE